MSAFDDLVALAERIEQDAGLHFEPLTLEQIRISLRPPREGVTPGGIPWKSYA